jgi:hypothetical protein
VLEGLLKIAGPPWVGPGGALYSHADRFGGDWAAREEASAGLVCVVYRELASIRPANRARSGPRTRCEVHGLGPSHGW